MTSIFMSAFALLVVVQCITCLEKTGTNVGATKPNKSSNIHTSESLSNEKVMAEDTEDNTAKQSMTNHIRSIITKHVHLIKNKWPLKGNSSSPTTAENISNPQTTTNDTPLKN